MRALDSALQVQGLALLFTAIYQTFRSQLTLFHAICVLHLLSLLGFGLTARGKYGHYGLARRIVLWSIKVLLAAAFLAFVAYIWITAPTFGSQPKCNGSTIYVVFFVSIDATNVVFRYTIMALMIAFLISAAFGTALLGLFASICGIRKKNRVVKDRDIKTFMDILSRIRVRDGQLKSDVRWKWVPSQEDLGFMATRTLINVYGVLMLELTISRNDLGSDEREWTFGQIIAIFLLLGVAAEVFNLVLAKIDTKSEEKPDEEEAAQQTQLMIEEHAEHAEEEGEEGSSIPLEIVLPARV